MKALVLLCFLLTSCGQDELHAVNYELDKIAGKQTHKIDPELAPILAMYRAAAPNSGHYDNFTEFQFGELPANTLGHCYITRYGWSTERRVIMRRIAGEALTVVALHELAHCLHDVPHSNDPQSIMAAQLYVNEAYWAEYLPKRLQELFTHQN